LDQATERRTQTDFAALPALARLVAAAARRPIPQGKPIVGASAFSHESGIHVSGLLRDPGTYEALDPTRFGLSRQIVLGKHSGVAAVRHALREHGLTVGDSEARSILDRVRAHAEALKRPVAIEELLSFHAATTPA